MTDSDERPDIDAAGLGEIPPEEAVPYETAGNGGMEGFNAMAAEVRAEQKKERRKRVLIIVDTLLLCALAAAFTILFRAFVMTPLRIDGDSMEDTLWDGNVVLVSKIRVRKRDPKRNEIVIAVKEDGTGNLVKRVIGLPGEAMYADRDGRIHIFPGYGSGNYIGEEIELPEQVAYATGFRGTIGTEDEPLVLKDDEFFLMGDNREVSRDSRFYGPVTRDRIVGVAVFRIFPLSAFGRLKPVS